MVTVGHPRLGRRVDDRGETLVEVLVALVIFGIAAVAILAGLEMAVKSSDLGRKQANGGSYVRSLAEAIQNSVAAGGYKNCAAANYYVPASLVSQAGIPSTYSTSQTAALSWNGTTWAACGSDNGSQQVTLKVISPGTGAHQATESLTITLRKPCSGQVPTAASPSAKPC